jgi:hypothetical protein
MSYQARFMLSMAIVFAFYVASNFATASLVPFVYGVPCQVSYLSTQCAFGADKVESVNAYIILGSIVGMTLVALRWFWRETVIYPFLMLFGLLCMAAIGYDLLLDRPIINSEKIVNDTVNILGSVIAASFTLLLVILRHQNYSPLVLAKSACASYAIKVVSVTFFVGVSSGIHGATELYLLYVVYAFGAFSLHLMTVCGFIAKTAAAKPVLQKVSVA